MQKLFLPLLIVVAVFVTACAAVTEPPATDIALLPERFATIDNPPTPTETDSTTVVTSVPMVNTPIVRLIEGQEPSASVTVLTVEVGEEAEEDAGTPATPKISPLATVMISDTQPAPLLESANEPPATVLPPVDPVTVDLSDLPEGESQSEGVPQPDVVPQEAPMPGSADPILLVTEQAKQHLAHFLNEDVGQIQVFSVEGVSWADASLGCPHPDYAYSTVITSGYLIVLQMVDHPQTYNYHADEFGHLFLCLDGQPIE